MPRLQIDLDAATSEALISLAGARGTTPAALVVEFVRERIHVPVQEAQADPLDASSGGYNNGRFVGNPPDALDAIVGSIDADPDDDYRAPPDPMDELVGKYHGDRINDIDEVVYGR